MKLLAFSDLHCSKSLAKDIVYQAVDADVIIGAGDFARARRNLTHTIDILKTIKKPAVLVAGNSESADELRTACADWPSATVLHGNGITIDGVDFFGIGGGLLRAGAIGNDFHHGATIGQQHGCGVSIAQGFGEGGNAIGA